MNRWSFDKKCFDLAEHFLGVNAPKQFLYELAQAVQDAVEEYGIPKEEDPGIQANSETPFTDNH
jgi:hypothetical protein